MDTQEKRDLTSLHQQFRKVRVSVLLKCVELAATFSVIFFGTLLYSFREHHNWIPPFLVLVCTVVLILFSLVRIGQLNRGISRPSGLGAAWMWLLWLVYGILFKEIHTSFGEPFGYLQSAVAMSLAVMSYWKDFNSSSNFMNAATFVIILLLFIPHSDTISDSMDRFILCAKVIWFYCLYVFSEFTIFLEKKVRDLNTGVNRMAQDRQSLVLNVERSIVQSSWTLMVSKPLVIFALVQIVPMSCIINSLVSQLKRIPRKSSPAAPRSETAVDIEHDKVQTHTHGYVDRQQESVERLLAKVVVARDSAPISQIEPKNNVIETKPAVSVPFKIPIEEITSNYRSITRAPYAPPRFAPPSDTQDKEKNYAARIQRELQSINKPAQEEED